MKIAIITSSFPAISETFIINHIVELIIKGHDITIFSDSFIKSGMIHKDVSEYKLLEKTVYRKTPEKGILRLLKIIFYFLLNIKHSEILIKSFSRRYYNSFAAKGYFFFEVLPFVKKEYQEFDVIHAHFGGVGNKIAMIKDLGLLKGHFITTFYGHDINDYRQIKTQMKYEMLERYCNHILFVTNDLLVKYKKLTNSTLPLTVLPSNINQNLFIPKKQITNRTELVIITVGRLIDWKGQDKVIDTLNMIKTNNPNISIRYHIIGTGAHNEDEMLKKKVSEYKLENSVVFWGPLSHNEVYLRLVDADVFILFGIIDKYGNIDAQANVIQEAQAVGLPVIVSDAGGLPEGIINNKTGYVVKENNIQELADKILFFYHNREKITEMGKEGIKHITQKYSTRVVFDKLFEIYNSL